MNGSVSKLSIMYRQIISYSRYISSIPMTSFLADTTYSNSNSSQSLCFKNLSSDHARIRSTMKSFQKMLNEIEMRQNVHNKNLSVEHTNDLHSYINFITQFHFYHNLREEIVYSKFKKEENNFDYISATEGVVCEHYGYFIYDGIIGMNNILKLLNKNNKLYMIDIMNDIISPSQSFINDTFEHIDEEDEQIYPMIQNQLTQNELKEIDILLNENDVDKRGMITEMELLSDQLQRKY